MAGEGKTAYAAGDRGLNGTRHVCCMSVEHTPWKVQASSLQGLRRQNQDSNVWEEKYNVDERRTV